MRTCARAALGVLGLAGVALAIDINCRKINEDWMPQVCFNTKSQGLQVYNTKCVQSQSMPYRLDWGTPSEGGLSTGSIPLYKGCPEGTTHCCMQKAAPATLAPTPAPAPPGPEVCGSFSGGVCGNHEMNNCQMARLQPS